MSSKKWQKISCYYLKSAVNLESSISGTSQVGLPLIRSNYHTVAMEPDPQVEAVNSWEPDALLKW